MSQIIKHNAPIFVQKVENYGLESCILTKTIQNDIINCNCERYAQTMLGWKTVSKTQIWQNHTAEARLGVCI